LFLPYSVFLPSFLPSFLHFSIPSLPVIFNYQLLLESWFGFCHVSLFFVVVIEQFVCQLNKKSLRSVSLSFPQCSSIILIDFNRFQSISIDFNVSRSKTFQYHRVWAWIIPKFPFPIHLISSKYWLWFFIFMMNSLNYDYNKEKHRLRW
jgi:hypothetical protein